MERNEIKRDETKRTKRKKAWFEVAFVSVSVCCLLSSSSILVAFLFVPVFDLLSFLFYFDTMRWRTEEADYVFLFASSPSPSPSFFDLFAVLFESIRIYGLVDTDTNNG